MVTRILNVKNADADGPRDAELRERCQYVAATTLIGMSCHLASAPGFTIVKLKHRSQFRDGEPPSSLPLVYRVNVDLQDYSRLRPYSKRSSSPWLCILTSRA